MEQVDVIVCGAGLAGLSSAKKLTEKGLLVKVLEATSRAGGKVLSCISCDKKSYFELGGQFVNEDMKEMIKLINHSGMSVVQTDVTPDSVEIDQMSKQPIDTLLEVLKNQMELNQSGADQRLSKLYENSITNEYHKKLLHSFHAELLNISPYLLSGQAVFNAIHRYQSNKSDLTHQSSGPMQHMIDDLVSYLGNQVHFQEEVQEVIRDNHLFKVKSNRHMYQAKAVILAIPPTVAKRIQMSVDIESHYADAFNSYGNGAVIKITWVYEKPFWHHFDIGGETKRLSGVLFTDPIGVSIIDSTKVGEEYRLTMFIGADLAISTSTYKEADRITFAENLLAQIFGKAALNYKQVVEKVWVNERFCGGGYSARVLYGGKGNAAEILREPFNGLVFASSELALSFPHFMEGAVRAGQYAAEQISQWMKDHR